MSSQVKRSEGELRKLNVTDLRKICEEMKLSTAGKKEELIRRIFSVDVSDMDEATGDSSNVEIVSQITQFMMQMLKEQQKEREEDRKEREEDRKLMLKLLESKGSYPEVSKDNQRSDSMTSIDSVGSDSKLILEKAEWMFETIERKLHDLTDEINNSLGSFIYKESVKTLQIDEDKLNHFIAEKKLCLNEQESISLAKRFQEIVSKIREKKTEAMKLCKQEQEEKKAGSLPSGIHPPDFYGESNKFPVWWESFDAVIHSNDKVSTFYKYRYLRQCMKGLASQCLDGFSPLVEHYLSALEHVKSRFGQPRKVVRHIVKSIIDMPVLNSNDPQTLRKSYDTIQGKLHTLMSYSKKIENPIDALVIPILESKLTNELKENWERELLKDCNENEFATVEKYSNWFCKEVKSRETVDPKTESKKYSETKKGYSNGNGKAFSAQALTTNTKPKEQKSNANGFCRKCFKQNHHLKDCFKFQKDGVKERWNFAKEKNLCFRCLNDFHPGTFCNGSCTVDGCTRKHHVLLHFTNPTDTSQKPESVDIVQALNSDVRYDNPLNQCGTTDQIMPTALARIYGEVGKSATVRIAFDTMCQDSFITESIVKRIGLKCEKNLQMEVNGFGEKVSSMKTGRVSFGLSKAKGDGNIFHVDALVRSGRICAPLEPVTINWNRCSHLRNLEIADQLPRDQTEVDILIGLNHYLKLVSGSMVRHPTDDLVPAALDTVFGYVIMGKNPNCLSREKTPNQKEKIDCLFIQVREKTNLEKTVENFWNLESIGILDKKRMRTNEERDAIDQFNHSIRLEGDRYCVKLPFRKDAPKLESNFDSAKRQLYAIERRLKKNKTLKEDYKQAMQDYEKFGFARKATAEEILEFSKGPEYFIPHHAVVREESVSTKTRVVFNASSPDRNGNSLNDCLLSGPALQPDIAHILLRFRTRKIAVMGDIAKMFCQTKIDRSDYRYQQYLWRDCDEEAEPTRYIMVRLMFGIKPSPFLAIGSVCHHAKDSIMKQKYPLGCLAAKDIYVDDYCGGAATSEEACELVSQLRNLFSEGGWKMTKFISNCQRVMESIPIEDKLLKKVVKFEDNEYGFTKALGIGWIVSDDVFVLKFSEDLRKPIRKVTKRNVLSKVSQIYDVFGFYSAFIIRAKIMIQKFWDLDKSWDDLLTGEIVEEFRQWEKELVLLDTIKIPRLMIQVHNIDHIALISFSDASEKAYGAIVYLRVVDHEGNIDVQYVMGKARVAPKKTKSLARLELMAILLAARLTDYVIEALHDLKVNEVHCFSDSQIALCWLQKSSTSWKTFVANRVQEIHDLFSVDTFHHIAGRENPADLISRGVTIEDFKSSSLLWKGPSWLALPQSEWIKSETLEMPSSGYEIEAKKVNVLSLRVDENAIVSKYEHYMKLIRIVAQILKWRKLVRRTEDGSLPSDSYMIAQNVLIRNAQMIHFPAEFEDLKNGKRVDPKSRLLFLDPIYDLEKKLIVVGGRLNYSNLPEEAKHQIIVPSHDLLNEKLILYTHVLYNHAPIETTLCILRQKFWIIHGRREVSKAIHKCLKCIHLETSNLEQKMAPLPEERVCVAPAFTNIGLDFTGHLLIKQGEKVTKAYVCVFTCMQSRMVHFELTLSMETEDFLNALRRLINRRGMCKLVISDNFSSFKKARRLLTSKNVRDFCAERAIEWKFITERSPFRGGFYERLNLSLKKPLKKVLGKALLSYVEMYTVLTDIECAINQRPLTYQGSDPKDLQAITPAHLALGRPLSSLPDIPTMEKVSIHTRYKYLQRLQDHFWRRWSKEYLPKLQVREKWRLEQPSLKVNDICLITEDNIPRSKWPMGRVIELKPGKDGIIRTVRLQTEKGIYTRPVQKLHLFESFGPTFTELQAASRTPVMAEVSAQPDQSGLRGQTSQEGEDVVQCSQFGRLIKLPDRYY